MNRSAEEELIFDALSRIETPACDMEAAVARSLRGEAPARPRRFPRAALLAAALLTVLAVGAAAVGIGGLWTRFFPNPVPPSAVTTIGVSQTSGDYTLTLEDTVVDNNGAILLFTLRRADGGLIDPKASLSTNTMNVELLADGEHFMGGGGFENPVLSDDGTSLSLCCELRSHLQGNPVGLAGKTLTFTADGVAVSLYSPNSYGYKPDEAVDLSPLSGIDIPDFSTLEHWEHEAETIDSVTAAIDRQNLSLPLPLNEEFSQYEIRGAVMLKNGLAVAITQGWAQHGDYRNNDVRPEALIDIRNGERYGMYEGDELSFSDGTNAMLYTFRDCPLTAADLPYLRLEVSYAMDHILSEEPFSLTFTADSGAAMILPLDKVVSLAGADLHPTELRLSALGVTLYFSDGMDAVFDAVYPSETAPVIVLKDGTVISTVWQGGSGGPEGCNVAFQTLSEDGARLFLDTAQIASVSLGGATLWTAGEYALTLTDVMADDDGAVFLLALTRTDGGPVNPEVQLQGNTVGASLRVDGEAFGTFYPRGSSPSEDGKTLYFCYELRKEGNTDGSVLDGEPLTFKTGGVVIPVIAPEAFPGRELTVPLSQPLPLAAEFPSFRFVSAEITDKGLAVTVTRGQDDYDGLRCIRAVPALLTDSRDGTVYGAVEGDYITLPDGAAAYRAYYGGGDALTEADLPYLSATYTYAIDKVLSDQPSALTFTPGSGSAQIIPLDMAVTVQGVELRLKELRFSALGLSLNLSSDVEDSYVLYQDGAEPVVHLKDGAAVRTRAQGGSGSSGRASVSFQPQDQDGQRVFLDAALIQSISLGGATLWRAP